MGNVKENCPACGVDLEVAGCIHCTPEPEKYHDLSVHFMVLFDITEKEWAQIPAPVKRRMIKGGEYGV